MALEGNPLNTGERIGLKMAERCKVKGGDPEVYKVKAHNHAHFVLGMERRLSMRRNLQATLGARAVGIEENPSVSIGRIDELPEVIITSGDIERVFKEEFGLNQQGEEK